jgi:hypothetical protein
MTWLVPLIVLGSVAVAVNCGVATVVGEIDVSGVPARSKPADVDLERRAGACRLGDHVE